MRDNLRNKLNRSTMLYSGVVILVLLLQNGRLNNIPIILLIVPILFCKLKFPREINLSEKFLITYFLYLFFITLINWPSNFDSQYSINLFIQYLIVYVSTKMLVRNINIEVFLLVLKKIGIVNSILCLIEALIKKNIWAHVLGKEVPNWAGRVVGIFNHPIVCGCFLLIALIIAIVYPSKRKAYQVFEVALINAAIILTQSRSTWIAVIFIIFLYMVKFFYRKINIKYFEYGLVLFVIAMLVSAVCQVNIFDKVYNFIRSRIKGSLQAGEGHIVRIEIILSSLEYWKTHFLSFCFGRGKNYGLAFLEENPVVKYNGALVWNAAIDNQYVSLVHESGLIGLSLIMCILFVACKRFVTCHQSDKLQIISCLELLGNSICLFFFEGFQYPVLVFFYVLFVLISDKARVSKKKCGIYGGSTANGIL